MSVASEVLLACPERLTLLSGDDFTTLPFIALGGHGCVSVASNVLPATMVALVNAARAGDLERARTLHMTLTPVPGALLRNQSAAGENGDGALGWLEESFRLPLCTDPAKAAILRPIVDDTSPRSTSPWPVGVRVRHGLIVTKVTPDTRRHKGALGARGVVDIGRAARLQCIRRSQHGRATTGCRHPDHDQPHRRLRNHHGHVSSPTGDAPCGGLTLPLRSLPGWESGSRATDSDAKQHPTPSTRRKVPGWRSAARMVR